MRHICASSYKGNAWPKTLRPYPPIGAGLKLIGIVSKLLSALIVGFTLVGQRGDERLLGALIVPVTQ